MIADLWVLDNQRSVQHHADTEWKTDRDTPQSEGAEIDNIPTKTI